jgi:hypothetical protein
MTTQTCRIDSELVKQLNAYSEATGVPVIRCINEAVERWLEVIAPSRIAAMQRRTVVFNENGVGGPIVVSGDAASEDLIAQVKERKRKK